MKNRTITQYIYESFDICSKVGLFQFLKNNHDLKLNADILNREAWSKKLNITLLDKNLFLDDDLNSKLKLLLHQKTDTSVDKITTLKYKDFYKMVQDHFCLNKKSINIDEYSTNSEKISQTLISIQDVVVEVILNAMFQYKNCISQIDILIRNKDGWIIIGVKMKINKFQNTSFISGFQYQYYILKNFITINDIKVCLLNDDFVYESKNNEKLIKTTNLIAEKSNVTFLNDIQQQQTTFDNIIFHLTTLLNQDLHDNKIQQKIFNAKFCFERPYKGDLEQSYCPHIFGEYLANKQTILNLYRMYTKTKIALLYEQPSYLLSDLVTNKKFYVDQTDNHKIQMNCSLNDVFFINSQKIDFLKVEVKKYKPPIYFFDFETFSLLVPKFKNTKPYSQIAFQYSIHVIKNWDDLYQDKYLHFEYLVEELDKNQQSDFREVVLKNLMHDLFKFGKGVYVCYYKSFEKGILEELKINFPKYAYQIDEILGALLDLKDFFNFNIYHPRFNGSFSLKDVYPVFAPEQPQYQDLPLIQNGMQASNLFWLFYNQIITQADWDNFYGSCLKEYCKLDTLAMVIIFKGVLKLLAPILC